MENQDLSKAAKELSKVGAAKGGNARKSVLTPDERREIARRAVETRWQRAGKLKEKPVSDNSNTDALSVQKVGPQLPYSMFRGTLDIGDMQVECHVLSDARRVLTQREVVRVLSGGRDSGNLARYLDRNPLFNQGFESGPTIQFSIPGTGITATGYEATLLIEVCETYLKAKDLKLLKPSQMKLAKQAEFVVRACAKVGIIALIDEATGYQVVREKQALQLKLQAFIADDMQEWARMFPEEFWLELARLENVRYSPHSRPMRWGKYVMAFVYDAVDKDVGQELRKLNPNPHFRQNHHQWLRQFGRDKVRDHLNQVLGVMKLCTSMDDFNAKFGYVFKKSPLQLTFFELIDRLSNN